MRKKKKKDTNSKKKRDITKLTERWRGEGEKWGGNTGTGKKGGTSTFIGLRRARFDGRRDSTFATMLMTVKKGEAADRILTGGRKRENLGRAGIPPVSAARSGDSRSVPTIVGQETR